MVASAVVVVLGSNQELAHRTGHEHQKPEGDEAGDGVEERQPFPRMRMRGLLAEHELADDQQAAQHVERGEQPLHRVRPVHPADGRLDLVVLAMVVAHRSPPGTIIDMSSNARSGQKKSATVALAVMTMAISEGQGASWIPSWWCTPSGTLKKNAFTGISRR